jgi:arsenate reductase
MNGQRTYNVLCVCTGNSARSILAESLLNTLGKGKFRAFSAGSFPKGPVHPMAIELLKRTNLPAQGFRSKSWDEFARPSKSLNAIGWWALGDSDCSYCPGPH